MYAPALEKIVYWLEKAAEVASPVQKETIEALISFYNTGDLKEYDRFNILWVQDTASMVDFVNGFTEVYGDPLGYKASSGKHGELQRYGCHPSHRNHQRQCTVVRRPLAHTGEIQEKGGERGIGESHQCRDTRRRLLSCHADRHQPPQRRLDKEGLWFQIRHDTKHHAAYAESSKGNGFIEEFIFRPEDRERITLYGTIGDNMHTDLHECLGHGSGQLAPGVKGDELKQYGSVLEEARADLFSLYYMADPKMEELGLLPDAEVAKAQYASYISNGMMTQLARVELGKDIEQTHMRNRKMISEWAYELGRRENVIEKVVSDGKTYIVVNDFDKLRTLFGKMLREVQRINRRRFRGGTRPGGTVRRQGGPQTARRGARTLRQTRYPALQRLREPDIHSCHGGRRNRGHHLRVPEKLHGTDAGLLVKVLFPPFGELTRGTFFRMPAYPGRYSRVLTETTLVASAGD